MRQGLFFEDLSIGQSAALTRLVDEALVSQFAAVSGDDNPVHLDAAYAAQSPFKERIAHGMLTGAFVSAVLGTQLPGPGAIYISQQLTFRRPVKLGSEVEARVTVAALDPDKGRVTLSCVCTVDGKSVAEGEAVVMAPRRPTA
jgi:3-hydroxybutyryl-CoA dehydratase